MCLFPRHIAVLRLKSKWESYRTHPQSSGVIPDSPKSSGSHTGLTQVFRVIPDSPTVFRSTGLTHSLQESHRTHPQSSGVTPDSPTVIRSHTGLTHSHRVTPDSPTVRESHRTHPQSSGATPDSPTVSTGGVECARPLGMRMDNFGRLIVADSARGIFRINVQKGFIETLYSSTPVNGRRCKFINDVVLARDGTILFTDSMLGGHVKNFVHSSGGLLAYSDKSNKTIVVLDKLAFPNGLELAR
ncbi:hypothetical protein Btru_070506 [Bulinus truncatus]|nr:hypothetical protein Btru_070506 [Bulinus truncatus]